MTKRRADLESRLLERFETLVGRIGGKSPAFILPGDQPVLWEDFGGTRVAYGPDRAPATYMLDFGSHILTLPATGTTLAALSALVGISLDGDSPIEGAVFSLAQRRRVIKDLLLLPGVAITSGSPWHRAPQRRLTDAAHSPDKLTSLREQVRNITRGQSTVLSAFDYHAAKPFPASFAETCRRLGVPDTLATESRVVVAFLRSAETAGPTAERLRIARAAASALEEPMGDRAYSVIHWRLGELAAELGLHRTGLALLARSLRPARVTRSLGARELDPVRDAYPDELLRAISRLLDLAGATRLAPDFLRWSIDQRRRLHGSRVRKIGEGRKAPRERAAKRDRDDD